MEYKLYYWDAPFRGNFIEYILIKANCEYTRHNASEIYPDKSLKINYPGMAPPYLYEAETKKYFSQMPAIGFYLAKRQGLLDTFKDEYFTLKVLADCHDVLTEITNFYGTKMWTPESWKDFKNDRFKKWLNLFDQYALDSPSLVERLSLAALIGPILRSFPDLSSFIRDNGPRTFELTHKVESDKQISDLLKKQHKAWGNIYCGGEIEESLRNVI